DLLTRGDPRGPRQLTLDALYDSVFREMRDAQQPLPRRQAGDRSGNLVLAPNPAVAVQPAGPPDEPQDPGRCPYPGLDAFGIDDSGVYHGRERMTAQLVAAVADSDGPVILVGPSGSGKTSLLNAGLLAALRDGGLPGAESRAGVRITPGAQPLDRLASRLDSASSGAVVLLVDQLEELFTLCANPAERTAFLRAVTAVAEPGDGRLRTLVVFTLRADFYGQAAAHQELIPSLRDRQLLVEPMTGDELRAAIERPAAAAGLTLDDGLADLILHELGADSGGALPLLSHVLWATWRQRSGSRLTIAGYRAVGGISEAIAATAEQVYGELDEPGREAVRRMLPRLVRVGEDAADTARPIERSALLHDLPDPHAAQRAIDRLTEARLLTLDRDTTRISHEILLRAWPRLKEWIETDRHWLNARQQLADDAGTWRQADRDPSLLYRGNRLAAVRERAAGAVLEPELAEFMDASWRHDRRGVRLRRIAVALLAVLSLVAVGLATWATKANQEAQRQLRIAQSRALAEDSARFGNLDPSVALQLAQAAWHTAQTPEAYGALFTQYTRLQPVEKMFQNLWQGNARRVMAGPGGSPAVFVDDGGLPSTWGGLNGPEPHQGVAGPQPHELTGGTFQLSPSGKLLGYANDTGTVVLWDLEHHTPAVMLRDTVQPARPVRALAFSADETRLLVKRTGYDGKTTAFEVWDLATRKTIPVADRIGPQGINTESAFFGPAPGTVVVGEFGGTTGLYDLATGAPVRSLPSGTNSGHVARNGAVVVQCDFDSDIGNPGLDGLLRVVDVATGAVQRTVKVPSCGSFEVDTSTNYALVPERNPGTAGGNGRLTLVDLATGESYRLTTPPLDLSNDVSSTDRYNDKVAVFKGGDGQPVVLIGDKKLLYRLRPVKPTPRLGNPGASQALSPRGDLGVTFAPPDKLLLNEVRTGATLATATRGPLCWGTCASGRPLDFTPDGKRLLAVYGDTLVVYSVPSLAVERRIPLPLPPDLGGPPTDDGSEFEHWSSSIAPVADDQVTVLHAGMLTRWNPADGGQIGTPAPVRADRDGLRRSAHKALLEPRWQHPEQAVVVQPSGDTELWNLDEHRVIGQFGRANPDYQGAVRFSDDGSLAGVRTPEGNLQVWDAETRRTVGRPIPSGGNLLGFTPDRKLIVTKTGEPGAGTAQIWDQDSGKQLAEMNWPAISPRWGLQDTTLFLFGGDEPQMLRLEPGLWFDTLCRFSNRDFTDDERSVLAQLDAPHERPCA
ncbi:WD40 repeat domain-containing protein, partial [Amycolatopsis japonica]|uniref:WD40 repeat domain-containing protein n=1 Tax=Amycolatopsis japonica TaxID=208439 RepID=UPI0033F545B0